MRNPSVARRTFRVWSAAVVAILSLAVRPGASTPAENSVDAARYQQLLRTYRIGPAQDAINELAAWPGDRLAAAAKASIPNLSPPDLMAAADLHGEVANALLAVSYPNVSSPEGLAAGRRQTREVLKVVNSALLLLHYAGRAPFGEQLGDEPKRSWYYAVASALLAFYRGPEALLLVGIALQEYPDDPLLLTARGTIYTRRPLGHPPSEDYTRAITLAPDLAIARLRLGQLYFERGSGQEARPWLESVAAGPATTSQQYFAHLLLGRIAANEHKVDESDAEYRRAYSIGAGYQTACIAVSRREEALDHQQRAADVAAECFQLSGHDDPWPSYRAKNDPEALPHLRAEARRR